MNYKIEVESHTNGSKKLFDTFKSYYKRPNDLLSPPHVHSYYEINYIKNGDFCYVIDDTDIRIKSGDIIIIYPNVIHASYTGKTSTPEDPTEATVIKFSPAFLYPQNLGFSDLQHLMLPLKFESKFTVITKNDPIHSELSAHILAAVDEMNTRAAGYELALRAHTSLLYSYILRELSVPEIPSPVQSEAKAANLDLIRSALEYVEEHYSEPITMQQLAKESNVNYYYFSRLFQQYTNQGFRDYLMKFRINKAVRMLLQTNESVTNIAIDCGFETISYFIKKFQEEMGVTPKNFRKQYYSIEDPNAVRTHMVQFVDAPLEDKT